MAEKLCTLRKYGGGRLKETVLWTNSAPTSAFAGQNVTLSADITNFTYIAVDFKYYTSANQSIRMIMPVTDFVYADQADTYQLPKYCFASRYNSTDRTQVRAITYVSNTQIAIGSAYKVNSAGTNNNMAIPTQIIGLK